MSPIEFTAWVIVRPDGTPILYSIRDTKQRAWDYSWDKPERLEAMGYRCVEVVCREKANGE